MAMTVVSAFMVTTHEPVPEQPPPVHPRNADDPSPVAVKVTCVPGANPSTHVDPQLIAPGEPVTVPVPGEDVPVPATVTRSTKSCAAAQSPFGLVAVFVPTIAARQW